MTKYDGIIDGKPVRKGWDYVAFADYEKDMEESSSIAARIIRGLRKQLDQAEHALALAVLAAGGKVEIPIYELQEPDRRYEFTQEKRLDNMTLVFTARRLNKSQQGTR